MRKVLYASLAMGLVWLAMGLVSGSNFGTSLLLGAFFALGTLVVLGVVVFIAGRLRRKPRAAPGRVITLAGSGAFDTEVKGESNYQAALEAICGPRCEEGENRVVDALLVPEDGNKLDPGAVRVEIDGRLVGYLSREAAPALRLFLAKNSAGRAACRAVIRGGWSRKQGRDQGHYGVWLDATLQAEPSRILE